jgi:hypothetical protein
MCAKQAKLYPVMDSLTSKRTKLQNLAFIGPDMRSAKAPRFTQLSAVDQQERAEYSCHFPSKKDNFEWVGGRGG